jgi:nicotinate-nucleotide pyrophosphorylase (carboxylating)
VTETSPAAVAARALAEDGARDITSLVTVAAAATAQGIIEVREAMVFAGRAYADAVVAYVGLPPISWRVTDGDALAVGAVAGTLSGSLRGMLLAERTLLNLLQRACGVATVTRRYVEAVAGTPCRILHTRKTVPGLRALDIAAVLAGGGTRHRMDLSEIVMVKDNHWAALRASGRTLAQALAEAASMGVVSRYVEVESLAAALEAVDAGATRLLIDNQLPAEVTAWAAAARARRPQIEIEATGGITLANVRAYAEAGVDFVSVGALTHSVRAADLALEIGDAVVA